MQINLSIKSIPVQNIYSQYLSGTYLINRRYQRKLVWSIEEKEKFIDSLLNGFPIPMIIAANHKKADGKIAFEILDGMQRLNSITSYIEGEFAVNSKYFDLEAIAQTKALKDNGTLTQKTSILSLEDCANLLDYPVPFSVCDESNTEKVDESFRRINTGGRTLSKQDVRQAGALGAIPDIIRDASIYVRKDSSHSNVLDLRNMKNISLSNKGLKYGINLFDVFWAKHEIIMYENVRKSRDEELVAQLITYIADKENAQTTSFYLDAIYQKGSREEEQLLKKINKLGFSTIYTRFCYVFDEIKKTLDSNHSNFKKLVFRNRAKRVPRVYQVLYIAFYKALVVQNLKIGNYVTLCKSLTNIYDNHLNAINNREKWNSSDREKLSDSILGVIRKHFSTKSGSDQNLSSWVESLENILNESQTEQACYDFKLGLNKISDNSGQYLPKTLSKIIKTLTAMTNTKPGDCYVILGVADKKEDAELHKDHYGSTYTTYNSFCITGIDSEAKKYHHTMSEYEQKILQAVEKEPISSSFKQQIKSNIVTFSYNNKEILLFKANRGNKPERYDESIYIRNLSHLEEITRDDEFDFFERFQLENTLSQTL